LDGFKRIDAAGQKQAEEAAVLAWLKQQGAAGKPALAAHAQLIKHLEEGRATRDRDLIVSQFNNTAVLGSALSLYRLSIERAKADAEREAGYQERDLPSIEGGLKQMDRRYVARMDQQLQTYWLSQYAALPAAQRNNEVLNQWLAGSDKAAIDGLVGKLAGTQLGSLDERLKWFKADRAAFEASTDPAIQYAVAVMPALLKQEEQKKTREGESLVSRPLYLQALADYKKSKGEFVYPDANLSLRIT
ncbi:S46 family peptidase, partial [Roseateles sp. P5_E1]